MMRAALRQKATLLFLVAAMALTGACGSGEPTDSSTPKPRPSRASPRAVPDGKEAKAILDQAFVGREELGSGSGPLQSQLGNTVAATPENVLSVTFAFTCTGKGKVAFDFTANGRNVSSAARTSTCDGSIFQQSIEVSEPGPISFEAEATGSHNGGFAYAYYAEKKQVA
ncbi:hypothetical protein [Streptomyces sp. AC550_RSS872]|uniref:hypothetical protein n=1 Tax=Streptomyces sp. AC550_RSS872 TaxID=2823689 RepID=UPI0020B7CE05|nr:hypothetical protein [Streptomyces sp. AC550_RSS872]